MSNMCRFFTTPTSTGEGAVQCILTGPKDRSGQNVQMTTWIAGGSTGALRETNAGQNSCESARIQCSQKPGKLLGVNEQDAPVTRSQMTRNNQAMSRCSQTVRVDYSVSFAGSFSIGSIHQSEQ